MSSGGMSGPAPVRQESRTLKIKRSKTKDQGFKRWPRSFINYKIHENDLIFFETLEEIIRLRTDEFSTDAARLAKDQRPDLPLPSDDQLGLSDCYQPLSGSQLEILYVEALYTIKHKIGTTTGSHLAEARDLYDYVQKAFNVAYHDHQRLMMKANDEKPPIVVLYVTVIEAKQLEAKDADGFSDPYCMLGIVPAKAELNSEQSARNHSTGSSGTPNRGSQKRKTPLEHIPARYIKATTVKDNTLNPVWSEKFRFDLEDVTSDRLHLDIWDHDDDTSVMDSARKLNEVKGFRGLGRYFKQIAQSARTSSDQTLDDFLGCVDVALTDIPSTGLDQWYDLRGRTAKSSVEGKVHLSLNLGTYEDRGLSEEEGLFEMREHRDLMSVFIRHECNLAKSAADVWSGDLSKAARTILHQHAIQGDLSELQQAACYWMALVQQFCYKSFDWKLLLKSFDDLNSKWNASELYREQEEALARSLEHFQQYCMALIVKQKQLLTLSDQNSRDRLQDMLQCLLKVHGSECFRRCCPFSKELKFEIISAVKKSVSERYKWLQDKRKSGDQVHCEDSFCFSYAEMIYKLTSDCNTALHLYTPAYNNLIEFCYFQSYFKQAHRLLCADFERDISSWASLGASVNDSDSVNFSTEAQNSGPAILLYISLVHFHSLANQLPPGCDRSNIGKLDIPKFFQSYLQHWIHLMRIIATNRVTLAAQLEEVDDTGAPQSGTSPIDVAFTFGQIAEFWLTLRWSEIGNPIDAITEITKIICDSALLYADLTHNKLKAVGYYDEIGQFDVTEQLCVTINNIEQVRRAMAPLPDYLRYEEEVRASVQNESFSNVLSSLYEQLSTTDTVIVDKIKQVVDRVADRMRPDINKFVTRLCWAPEKAQAADVIDKLMNYLDSNLTTLSTNMLKVNFERILDSIWIELLEEITDVISSKDQDFRNAHWISNRLSDSLEILIDFFHADGKGLPMSAIHCPLYTEVYKQLKLNQMPMEELMEEFFQNKLQLQEEMGSSKYGTLYVRVHFKREASLLLVEVVSAKNLLPLDKNGLSDPYVILQLRPEHLFPDAAPSQTKVISRNLNPEFNDTFEFQITEDQCLARAACIVFTVMDHDVLSANDFAGEAYLSLAEIHGVSKRSKKSGQSALTPQGLPLMNPHSGDDPSTAAILSALSLKGEQKGTFDFIRRRKSLYNVEAD